jgi:hypothetical protein
VICPTIGLIEHQKTNGMEHFCIFSGILCVLMLLISILSIEPNLKTTTSEEGSTDPLQTALTEEIFTLEQTVV